MSWNGHDPAQVSANRRRYLESHGLDWRKAVAADQVHGIAIHVASTADGGRGMDSALSRVPATDAFITREKDLVLTTLHADCAPVYLFDPALPAIGLVHTGWRGALAHLPSLTASKMAEEWGCKTADFQAAIGPTIGADVYEIGQDVAAQFLREFGTEVLKQGGNKPVLDLYAVIVRDLVSVGLHPGNIFGRPPCTFSSPFYASFRRDGSPVPSMMAWLRLI